MYWEPVMTPYPLTAAGEHLPAHHVRLPETGRDKLAVEGANEFTPGKDYVIKEEGGLSWLPFPDCAGNSISDTPGCSCDGCGPELLPSSVRPYLDTSPVSISALQRS